MYLYSRWYEQCFMCPQTAEIIRRELFPVLEKIARTEFGVVTMRSLEMDNEEIMEAEFSEKKIEAIAADYLKKLLKMHFEFNKSYVQFADQDFNPESNDLID